MGGAMAYPSPKGSIILKILIVVLICVLILILYYPGKMWTRQAREEGECRFRMLSLMEAQQMYFMKTKKYANNLDTLRQFYADHLQEAKFLDTLMIVISRQDTSEKKKLGIPLRLYLTSPISIDSIFHCPTYGQPYILLSDSTNRYAIKCPVQPDTVRMYIVFKKIFINHGTVNQNREISWKKK
jgi:hypothetical protein